MLIHWIWLSQLTGITSSQKIELLKVFRDPEEIYKADPESFSVVENLSPQTIQRLENRDLHDARKILIDCTNMNISILTYGDAAYPFKLKNIAHPPLVLYYRGCLPDWESVPVIGIVGTRKASIYGLQTARQLGSVIAKSGALVVSGGALGIDTQALEGALQEGKKVVVVLGFGSDVVYPAKNRALFERIEQQGCLITEYIPGTPPNSWNFPQRNRIITGISNGVVIVEAPARSGALNSAQHALDQGRDVFVVPGNVNNSGNAGSNQLLRDGAIPILSGNDVIKEYEYLYPEMVQQVAVNANIKIQNHSPAFSKDDNKSIDNPEKSRYSVEDNTNLDLTQEERTVLSCVPREPDQLDRIIVATGLPAGKVLAALTMLALKGKVQSHPGKAWSLK